MDDNSVWIAEWEAGVTGYEDTDQVLAGRRMFFAAGGGSGQEAGIMNFTEDGQTIFLNAVDYMAGKPSVGTIHWDFEDGNDHDFTLWSVVPPIPTADDPNTAGDEALTGGLPDAGVAWTIGQPDQFDGLIPVFVEGCHVVNGVLKYGPCNNPFSVTGESPYDFTNGRGQSGYLGTYALSQWGDNVHSEDNDQIATSPVVMLDENAVLTVWAFGGSDSRMAPELDPNGIGYLTNSSGIAVLSAADGSLLASQLIAATGGSGNMPAEYSLDLSDLAGQEVIVEVVDAFAGGWGWITVDEIEIVNAVVASTEPED
jgi:hypothetical protein